MDRRMQKTQDSIFNAFDELITQKEYSKISVTEIIQKANIGRSTFYDHFETKEYLLESKCNILFDHIFTNASSLSESHINSYTNVVEHILWHIEEEQKVIRGILKSEGAVIFFNFFQIELYKLLEEYNIVIFQNENKYYEHFIIKTFLNLIDFWVLNFCDEDVETISKCFFKFINVQ